MSLSSVKSLKIHATECGTSSSVSSNIFSLTISQSLNSKLLEVISSAGKYFTLSVKYLVNTSSNLSMLSSSSALTGTISAKLYKSFVSSIFFIIC